jgi:hypothetical protein
MRTSTSASPADSTPDPAKTGDALFDTSSQTSTDPRITPSPTNSTQGAATTSGIVRSDRIKKPSHEAIVGGVLGGLTISALIICLIFYIRRNRCGMADTGWQKGDVSPFTMQSPDPDITGNSGVRRVADGLTATNVGIMSKSGFRAGDRNLQVGSGTGGVHQLQQPNHDDIERYQVPVTLPSPLLAQIGDVMREEFAAALRTQARYFQGAPQRPNSMIGAGDDNNGPPPEYLSERGGGRGG